MDDYSNYIYEDEVGRAVTPEEAMNNLVSAIVLRAVLDYRDELFYATTSDEDANYYILKTQGIRELEMFFNNIGFLLYKDLPDKIIDFKKKVDKLKPRDFTPGKEKSYICPICGGTVNCKKVKIPNKHSHNGQKPFENRVSCNGCLMRVSV